MKEKIKWTIILVNLALLLGITGFLVFQAEKKTEPAFIDLAKVYNEFDYKKKVEQLLQAEDQKRRFTLDSLAALAESYRSGKVSDPGERERLENELNTKSDRFQKEINQLSNHYDQLIWNAINKYVSEFGKKHAYSLILGTKGEGNVMYAEERIDVSEQVIEFINASYAKEE